MLLFKKKKKAKSGNTDCTFNEKENQYFRRLLGFKPIPERATLHSCVSDQGKIPDSTNIEFKWRVRVHFAQNIAKNNDSLKKWFEQKLF